MMVPQGTSCMGGMAPWPRAASRGAPTVESAIMAAQRVTGQSQDEAAIGQFGQHGGVARAHGHAVNDQPAAQFRHGAAQMIRVGDARSRRW